MYLFEKNFDLGQIFSTLLTRDDLVLWCVCVCHTHWTHTHTHTHTHHRPRSCVTHTLAHTHWHRTRSKESKNLARTSHAPLAVSIKGDRRSHATALPSRRRHCSQPLLPVCFSRSIRPHCPNESSSFSYCPYSLTVHDGPDRMSWVECLVISSCLQSTECLEGAWPSRGTLSTIEIWYCSFGPHEDMCKLQYYLQTFIKLQSYPQKSVLLISYSQKPRTQRSEI